MNAALSHLKLLAFALLLLALNANQYAMAQSCESTTGSSVITNANANANAFSHQFDSGAQWNLCWHIDDNAGLKLSEVHFGPPAEPATKILDSAALAQILFKYDEDVFASHLLSSDGLGAGNHKPANTNNCPTGTQLSNNNGESLCIRYQDLNIMTSVRRSQSLRRHEVSIHAFANIGAHSFEQVWRLSEDGQITPEVRMSGELERFTLNSLYGNSVGEDKPYAANATLLLTWRLDFNIGNTPNNDIVEQVEFLPSPSNQTKRSITTTAIDQESGHKVQRDLFRGWLIKDSELSSGPSRSTRMGYYIDPQSSGFNYANAGDTWSQYDLSVTKNEPCELLASKNLERNGSTINNNQAVCGNGLDDYLNGESLTNNDPVVWFSLARQFIPKAEDLPAISTRTANFKIIPFDWSASTPFTPIEDE